MANTSHTTPSVLCGLPVVKATGPGYKSLTFPIWQDEIGTHRNGTSTKLVELFSKAHPRGRWLEKGDGSYELADEILRNESLEHQEDEELQCQEARGDQVLEDSGRDV